MAPIATYVFLDLGTTGKDPKIDEITELCMLAVDRQDLLKTHQCFNGTAITPRDQQKLLQCYKPNRKMRYQASSSGNGGFTDEDLKDENLFDLDSFRVIDDFINTLDEPVCLFAHFGHIFDYPILKRHLERVPAKFTSAGILCADTHQAFYDLYHPKLVRNLTESASVSKDGDSDDQKKSTIKPFSISVASCHQINGARRLYPWGPEQNMPSVSYKLTEVYTRVFRRQPADAHKAEVDCILMLELAVKLGQEFVDWADNDINCLSFPDRRH